MEITDLSIQSISNHFPVLAQCEATLDHALSLRDIIICQAKKGIYVKFPSAIGFTTPEQRKRTANRILATYVINHCVN
ncbi:MAG: septation protein SpoVG family protein [Fibrobacteres bacterium]|nr:septation protein SpoVG family protein [Fibrobacterota bacterium]